MHAPDLASTYSPSLAQALSDYLEIRGPRLKATTRNCYAYMIRTCLADWLYMPLKNITKDMVRAKHRDMSGYGKAQANLTFRVLRAIFSFAEDHYTDGMDSVIVSNPVAVLSRQQLWNENVRRQDRITPAELPRWFIAVLAVQNETERDFMLALLLTGCRKNELGKLQFKDVDLHKGTISIPDTKSRNTQVFPLSDVLWWMLKRRFESAGYDKTAFVFASPNGLQLSYSYRGYLKIRKLTGIFFSPHTCRRTFCSTATELGIHVYSIQKLMNHAIDKSSWTNGYFVADLEDLRKNAQAINDRMLEQAEIRKEDLLKLWK